jgi:hypothetical protein
MLAHCDLIAFIATTQPEQARVFYSEVLELPLMEDTPLALVFDAHGTMLPTGCATRCKQTSREVVGVLNGEEVILCHTET